MSSKLGLYLKQNIIILKNSGFVQNVALVGGGIAIAHAIALIFMPFITRLYGPEAFGIAAAFNAVINIVTPMATLGFASAIVLTRTDKEAGAVARLSILCGGILSAITLLIVLIGKDWIIKLLNIESAPYILYLIPISIITTAFLSVANQSAIRSNLFKEKSRAYIESTLVKNIMSLIGGLISPSGIILIIVTLFGQIINFAMQILHMPRILGVGLRNWFGFKGVLKVAYLYYDFAIYRMPQGVLNSISNAMPTILLASMFGAQYAGQYSLAIIMLGAPAMLLGQAVSEVFYPKVTNKILAKSTESIKLLFRVSLILLIVGLVPFGTILFFGKAIVSLVFGHEWELAGNYTQWLSLWLLTTLIADVSVAALPALKLQKYLLAKEIFSVTFRLSALYIGGFIFDSDIIAVALFSMVGIGINILLILLTFKHLNMKCKEWGLVKL